jgi:hypothetical protein
MSSEAALWQVLKPRLEAEKIDGVRVENVVGDGTPDVNYGGWLAEGWLELKHLDDWPARSTTPVDHGLTREQALWARRRCRAGCRSDILIRVGREVYLFAGRDALALVNDKPNRAEFIERALFVGWPSIMEYLKGC